MAPSSSPHDAASSATDDLVLRVRKLLDKAERTDNVHEAEAFARKAAEIVATHRIDAARVAGSGSDVTVDGVDALGIREINVGRGAYARGRLALLTGLAGAHDVRVVFRAMPEGTVAYAAGFESDLELVEMMYHSLHRQAAAHMADIKRPTGAATQRFRRSFLFGFADRIGEIVADARRAVEDGTIRSTSSTTAVALRERSERVDEFATESWGRVRSAGRPSPVQTDGYDRGVTAAERADIGRGRLSSRAAIGSGR